MRNKRLLALLTALLLALICVPSGAEHDIDFTQTGSIVINLLSGTDEQTPLEGAVFELVFIARAAEEDGQLAFIPTEDFQDFELDLNDLHADGLIERIEKIIDAEGVSGMIETTDENGSVEYHDLELGLYLMRELGNIEGYFPVPTFLMTVPMTSAEGDSWVYDIVANPKAGTVPYPVEPEYKDFTVRKLWVDDGNGRPESVSITLFCDGEFFDTVTLSGENGWTYTWERLDMGHSYTASEDVPEGYLESYDYGDAVITVTNTAKLPQTGQLNWPVPLMAGAGLLLIMIGFAFISMRKNDA